MCSDDVDIKFCFIDLQKLQPVDKDSVFCHLTKFIKTKYNIKKGNLSKCFEKGDEKNNCCESENTIIVAFAKMRDLHDRKTYKNLINNKQLRGTFEEGEDCDYYPCPIIVIGMEELPGVLEERIRQTQDGKSDSVLENQKQVVNSLNLDAKVNFFDSSIWHHYIPLNENFLEKFGKIINEIKEKFKSNLYRTNIAREYLEFQTRLLANSYLAKLSGGHATNVNPFHFHSATEMELKAKKLARDAFFVYGTQSKLKWRLLILDDYAHTGLRCKEDTYGNGSGPVKIKIIRKVLGLPEEVKDSDWIQIKYVGDIDKSYLTGFKNIFSKDNGKEEKQQSYEITIDEDIKKLEAQPGQIYDIILVDYLLAGDNKNEYCTNLFEWIKDERANYKKSLQGPLKRFWFFPISVFSYALHEEIRQMGYMQLEEEWHIARGADPVNTPDLFRYSLFKFMEMQVRVAQPHKYKNIKSFFENVFPSKNDDCREVKKQAKLNYTKFIEYLSINKILWKDKENTSLFAETILPEKGNLDDAFWWHLHHLIFMLGHEPANEWAKMWDEFNIIEDKLIRIGALAEEGGSYLEPIKNYIINLQKQAR